MIAGIAVKALAQLLICCPYPDSSPHNRTVTIRTFARPKQVSPVFICIEAATWNEICTLSLEV